MSLVEFLSARLDEDHQWAVGVAAAAQQGDSGPLLPSDPRRILRDVVAKRAVVERYARFMRLWPPGFAGGLPIWTLRDLAAVYVDHPDYRSEWADP